MKVIVSDSIGYGIGVLPTILWSWCNRSITIGWLFWGVTINY